MSPNWPRFAYAAEFLLALPAVLTLWSQVGGQGHLDLMPWYWKLLLGVAMSLAFVFATAALVERPDALNSRFLAWAGMLVLIGAAMALVTYYYHVHEAADETDEEEPPTSAQVWMAPQRRS